MKGLPEDEAVQVALHTSSYGHDVYLEIKHAIIKHGLLRNPERSMVILMEEVGEAAKEIVGLKEVGARERAFKELMQVAAVAMRLAVQIKEDVWRTTK